MNEPPYILAIDQGTTSTRAILFDSAARMAASHAIELRQIYPANGWVEHDANEIWVAALACCRIVLKGIAASDVAGIGITNQRETRGGVGPRYRRTDPQRHRLAGSPHRRALPCAERGGQGS